MKCMKSVFFLFLFSYFFSLFCFEYNSLIDCSLVAVILVSCYCYFFLVTAAAADVVVPFRLATCLFFLFHLLIAIHSVRN